MVTAGAADDPPPTEVVPNCDLCGSERSRHLLRVRDRVHGLPGSFDLVACEGCSLVRLSPRPVIDQVGFYYPIEDYTPYLPPVDEGTRGRLTAAVRDGLRSAALHALGYPGHNGAAVSVAAAAVRRVAPLRRFGAYRSAGFPAWQPGGRALELGSGNGHFLHLLARNGWSVTGLDISPAAAAAARRLYGLDIVVGQLGDDPLESASFDFVHMRHVIEHVPSPRAALQRVAELLAPGGRVYLETPNVAGTGFQRYGSRWFPLEVPRHLWLFSPATLRRLCTESGLRVTASRTSTYITPHWAAAFREQDRTRAQSMPSPVVPAGERRRVVRESLVDRARLLADRDCGDILGMWAERA